MNCLIFLPTERQENTIRLTGDRARYVFDFHDLKVGAEITVGELAGELGRGVVQQVGSEEVVLTVSLSRRAEPTSFAALIVAVPRPQTVKKVLQYSAMLGITEVHLVRAEKTVPSYLGSKALEPENIERELIKGLEQAIATQPPQVAIYQSFREFRADALPHVGAAAGLAAKIIADPTGSPLGASIDGDAPFVVAIGPEKGWSTSELEQFTSAGFALKTLGGRVLRVEVALAALWGAIRC